MTERKRPKIDRAYYNSPEFREKLAEECAAVANDPEYQAEINAWMNAPLGSPNSDVAAKLIKELGLENTHLKEELEAVKPFFACPCGGYAMSTPCCFEPQTKITEQAKQIIVLREALEQAEEWLIYFQGQKILRPAERVTYGGELVRHAQTLTDFIGETRETLTNIGDLSK